MPLSYLLDSRAFVKLFCCFFGKLKHQKGILKLTDLYRSISWCCWRIFNLVFLHWTFYWNYLIFLINGPMSLQYWTKSSKKNWCSGCLSRDHLSSFRCTIVQSYNSTTEIMTLTHSIWQIQLWCPQSKWNMGEILTFLLA